MLGGQWLPRDARRSSKRRPFDWLVGAANSSWSCGRTPQSKRRYRTCANRVAAIARPRSQHPGAFEEGIAVEIFWSSKTASSSGVGSGRSSRYRSRWTCRPSSERSTLPTRFEASVLYRRFLEQPFKPDGAGIREPFRALGCSIEEGE